MLQRLFRMAVYEFSVHNSRMTPLPGPAAKALKAMRARTPLTVRDVAEELGRPHSTYASYEDKFKKKFLPADLTRELVPVFGKHGIPEAEVLALAGMGPTRSALPVATAPEDYIAIGRYDASFSMGPGALGVAEPEPIGFWLLERQYLNSISRTAPDNLAIVRADGESMIPTLMPGDWVLIDRKQTRLSREGIYAIRVGDDVWIKRLSLNLREKLVRIISDNQAIPVQDVQEEELEVIGRVVALVARKMA
jgi:phage repressor protein C with HTH and peptisase S24 domain